MQVLFDTWFRPFRMALGYSPAQAARQAGVSEGQWLRWDTRENTPRPDAYETIAKGLGYDSVNDWLKDFIRFMNQYRIYLDSPWTEATGTPYFVPRFGKKADIRSSEIGEAAPPPYHFHRDRPLNAVIVSLQEIEGDPRVSLSAEEQQKQDRQKKHLLDRAAILQEDIFDFRHPPQARPRKKTKPR